jgi:serine/threonine protein kinase
MSDTRPPTPQPDAVGKAATQSAHPATPPAPKVQGAPIAAKYSMADLLIGTTLADRYRLVSKLGEGAMGWVFLAEHVEIGKRFAVKVLRPSLCRMPEAVSRFRREARAASQIGSQHVVDVTDFGTTDTGAAFYVMEHLEGDDLATAIKRVGKMPWPRVQHILVQLCNALQAAHDQGIIHRDVKPANFFLQQQAQGSDFVKVLDFGIARLATPKDSIVTQTGVVMGTPDYMAPEQAQGRHVDHRADIYSLGASAYAMLTGRPPFVGKNEYDVIYKQLNDDPQPPSTVAKDADIPGWVDDVILRAMRKNPEERWATMRDFAEAVREAPKHDPALEKSSSAIASSSVRKSSVRPGSAGAKKSGLPMSPLVLVLIFVGLAVASGLAVMFALK